MNETTAQPFLAALMFIVIGILLRELYEVLRPTPLPSKPEGFIIQPRALIFHGDNTDYIASFQDVDGQVFTTNSIVVYDLVEQAMAERRLLRVQPSTRNRRELITAEVL